jgi:hypothetical protein
LDDRVDEFHYGAENASGLRRDAELQRLSAPEPHRVPLGHFDHRPMGIYRLQRQQTRRVRDVITGTHESLTNHPGKGRAHSSARDLQL